MLPRAPIVLVLAAVLNVVADRHPTFAPVPPILVPSKGDIRTVGELRTGGMVSCSIVQPCLAYRFCKRVALTLEVQTRSVLLRRSVVNRDLLPVTH